MLPQRHVWSVGPRREVGVARQTADPNPVVREDRAELTAGLGLVGGVIEEGEVGSLGDEHDLREAEAGGVDDELVERQAGLTRPNPSVTDGVEREAHGGPPADRRATGDRGRVARDR